MQVFQQCSHRQKLSRKKSAAVAAREVYMTFNKPQAEEKFGTFL
jgi:hypothetical protein